MTRSFYEKEFFLLNGTGKNQVHTIEDNLLDTIRTSDFEDDLKGGSGSELAYKFKAIYSSSALAVNFFGFLKYKLKYLFIFNERDFSSAQFEKKLYTGLNGTPPNLDFYLENEKVIIGIESKFLEPFNPTIPYFSTSYSSSFLSKIDPGLPHLVNYYNGKGKMSLDIAQLVKHSIGLVNNKGSKKAQLIYLYWTPKKMVTQGIFMQHQQELKEFESQISKIKALSFTALSYRDLVNSLSQSNIWQNHLRLFSERYLDKV